MSEISRVLRPKGWAAIVLNHSDHMREIDTQAMVIDSDFKHVFDTDNFSASDGAALFPACFGKVQIFEYRFEMKVADAKMLTDYARSIAD